ncbi:MAG: hypothetical protein A3J65_03950 [Candidatus Buchananbacteria bacterium RIFCSPHIGHO2_02_FULL_45_11b]|uniref:Membrane fusion protein biotin-lipoyl like domain-containing protein n=1 Tax=Candidatus Buchananbacteria bacterium RIFCSPHIGHO2_02_FULL_45_11b TaxID=1797541 RepID=A0A1G1YJN0_9BACT|nr:MAG: hypothetical protein A3J65_03950 [Candidatus Buchananbacteria bacterium RIFCSPHIGHO2_02_FULL_45_11b]
MKKILKSKIFWAIIIILIIGGVAAKFLLFKGKITEYVTQDVKLGSIIQTVSATGQVKSASEIELNFKNAGQLAVLNVKTGDKVLTNQVLAQLKATDLAISVTKAQADLLEAQANFDKTKAGATKEDIAVYQAAADKAGSDLISAQTDLSNAKSTYSQTRDNEEKNVLVDVNSALTKANISLQKIYDTIYYEGNETTNNFSVSDPALLNTVKNGYAASQAAIKNAQTSYEAAKIDYQDSQVNAAVTDDLDALNELLTTLTDLSNLLDKVITTGNLTLTELDTLKTNINTEKTTTAASLSAVQTGWHDLADARLNYQTKVKAAEEAVAVAQSALAKAEADLAYKKAPARIEDVALYEARLRKAQADLRLAQEKYDETIIRAPIDGVITDTNFSAGEQTSLVEPVVALLAAQNYEIEVDIPESDIVKINVLDEADITLDAFSGDNIFKGKVAAINPAQTKIQDVVYYKVTVIFIQDQPEGIKALTEKIKPGMTANITVKTAQIDNVLIIPQRAVKEKDGKKTVDILANGKPQTMAVELGLKGDEGLIELKSGLNEGDKVITFVREK